PYNPLLSMLSGYHWNLKKVNGVHAVFLQDRYSIYPHLSAKGMITIVNISCQYKPTQSITEMFLFDLQIAAFIVLKKEKCIAAITTRGDKDNLGVFLWFSVQSNHLSSLASPCA
ncbi:MAG TPA: hypothetical protein VEF33_06415, partial [Syntrophales bacterium]|nr:hypothetical protein [Syntrophales bacterium]